MLTSGLSYVEKRFKTADGDLVQRIAWDCIPRNLVRLPNGEIADFDLEFERDQAFKLEELCVRGLICWFSDHAEWAVRLYPEALTSRDKIQRILAKLFTSIDVRNTLDSVTRVETGFRQWVHQNQQMRLGFRSRFAYSARRLRQRLNRTSACQGSRVCSAPRACASSGAVFRHSSPDIGLSGLS